jgi:hypothetical protein
MFCRYRKTAAPANGPASCCAGEGTAVKKAEAGQRPPGAMAERLRATAPQRQGRR